METTEPNVRRSKTPRASACWTRRGFARRTVPGRERFGCRRAMRLAATCDVRYICDGPTLWAHERHVKPPQVAPCCYSRLTADRALGKTRSTCCRRGLRRALPGGNRSGTEGPPYGPRWLPSGRDLPGRAGTSRCWAQSVTSLRHNTASLHPAEGFERPILKPVRPQPHACAEGRYFRFTTRHRSPGSLSSHQACAA